MRASFVLSYPKEILKSIFPAALRKRLFLLYNKARILTIDRVLYPEYPVDRGQFRIFRKGYPFRENEISLDDLPNNEGKRLMRDWYDWTQDEFLLILEQPLCIEPTYGWGIVGRNELVYYSLGVSRTWFQPKPPVKVLWSRSKAVHLPRIISLRDTGEENYFHFFNDVLSKLFFLLQQGIQVKGTPLIVGKKLWDMPYFKYFIGHSPLLSSFDWHVQTDEVIICEQAVFCKPLTNRKDLWDQLLSSMSLDLKPQKTRRIFLTRSRSRLRFLENGLEIEQLCRQQQLDVVDADDLSPAQQTTLFSQASLIVGIHGAGLTNMVFSPRNCRVLEIFPPPTEGYLPYHYILLAKTNGFKYRMVIGAHGKERLSGGFYLEGGNLLSALLEIERES